MISVSGPDGTTFQFPDDTAPDVMSGAVRKHYGTDQAGPQPSGGDVSAISAAESLPIIGAYAPKAAGYLRHLTRGGTTAENQAQIEADIANYRQQHPIESTVGGMAISALPYAVAGEFAPAAKALGMTGRLATAAPRAALTGAGIGAADALARGEDPRTGAVVGGLSGAGGVALGKGAGMVYDAARGMFRPQAPVQRFLPDVLPGGVRVPASESQLATAAGRPDIAAARDEDIARKMGGDAGAIAATHDAAATQAMQDAHANMEAQLGGQPPGTPRSAAAAPLQAGSAARDDLVAQEQARAQAEVARMAGVQQQGEQLRAGLGPAPAAPPASALDAAESIGEGIRTRQAAARQATRDAYDVAAAVPAGYNPNFMRNVGETLLDAVNARPDVVRVDPDNTPAAFRAVQSIDRQIRDQLLNAARRGEQLGPMEMEQIRKSLVAQQGNAIAAARASNNYEDVRAISRVRDAFDEWEQQLAQTPGGLLHGDPAQIFATRQAARAAHAQERATFGRQGPGDTVGTFMGKVLGKYPGQEMSPEKIVSTLLGTPNQPAPLADAVPILNHLRDNVFGANSLEWAQLKQGLLDHLLGTAPGSEPEVSIAKQIQRLQRFLANERHSGAIFTPQERAQLATHVNDLRAAAPDVAPPKGTAARDIAELAGRFGQPAGRQEVFDALFRKGGEQLAAELRDRLPTRIFNQLRQAVWRSISEAPEGMMPWQNQKMGQNIADFLNEPLAHEMFNANERAMMSAISRTHLNMVPPVGSVNTSGSAYTGAHLLKGLKTQLMKMIFTAVGHVPGYVVAEGLAKMGEKRAAQQATEEATRMFIGPRPRYAPVMGPQRFGATLGRAISGPLSDQAAGQGGE